MFETLWIIAGVAAAVLVYDMALAKCGISRGWPFIVLAGFVGGMGAYTIVTVMQR